MFTNTTKQIMAPVAEAISHLMLLNMEAEANNTLVPDLTEYGSVVHEQAKNLVEIGKQMMLNGDEILKQTLPEALDSILKSSRELLESCFDLKRDPRSRTGRKSLLAACSKLLDATIKLLDLFDDNEVRRIVDNCEICISNIGVVREVRGAGSIVSHVRAVSEQVTDVAAVAKQRIDELVYPALKSRLADAIENVERANILVISTSKVLALDDTVQSSIDARNVACDSTIRHLRDIIRIVSITSHKDFDFNLTVLDEKRRSSSNHNSFRRPASRYDVVRQMEAVRRSSVYQKDVTVLDHALSGFETTTTAVLKNIAENAARYQQDSVELQHIKQETANIKYLESEIFQLSKRNTSEDSSEIQDAKNYELQDKMLVIEEKISQLDSKSELIVSGRVRSFISTNKNSKDRYSMIGQLKDSVVSGDQVKFESVVKQTQGQQLLFFDALGQIAVRSDNSEAIDAFHQFEQGTEDVSKVLVATAATATARPKDRAAQEGFQSALAQWEILIRKAEDMVRLYANVDYTELIAYDYEQLSNAVGRFEHVIKANDTDSTVIVAIEIRTILIRIVDTLSERIKNSTDGAEVSHLTILKSKLQLLIEELNKLLAAQDAGEEAMKFQFLKFSKQAKTLLANYSGKGEDNSSSALPESGTTAPLSVIIPVETTKEIKLLSAGGKRNSFVTIKGEEIFLADAAVPEPIDETEAFQNPIKAAARDLQIVSSQWSSEGNPVIDLSLSLARKMELLSQLYRENTLQARKQMIDVSKDIYKDCLKFAQEGHKIQTECTDQVLKSQLAAPLESISSVAVQLKIVTAVKASESSDEDSEKQLVLCSKNLMHAVKSAIKYAESASLRMAALPPNSLTKFHPLKFRKVVYLRSL